VSAKCVPFKRACLACWWITFAVRAAWQRMKTYFITLHERYANLFTKRRAAWERFVNVLSACHEKVYNDCNYAAPVSTQDLCLVATVVEGIWFIVLIFRSHMQRSQFGMSIIMGRIKLSAQLKYNWNKTEIHSFTSGETKLKTSVKRFSSFCHSRYPLITAWRANSRYRLWLAKTAKTIHSCFGWNKPALFLLYFSFISAFSLCFNCAGIFNDRSQPIKYWSKFV